MYSTFQSVWTMRHLNTALLYFGAVWSIVRDDKVSCLAAAFEVMWEIQSLKKSQWLKHAKERVHMQQRSSVILTGNCGKRTGWTGVFIITLQRIDQISFSSDHCDMLSTISLVTAVFRQFVAQVVGKMLEAAEDLYQSLLSNFIVNCKHIRQ